MPTNSDGVLLVLPITSTSHSTCPPDNVRIEAQRQSELPPAEFGSHSVGIARNYSLSPETAVQTFSAEHEALPPLASLVVSDPNQSAEKSSSTSLQMREGESKENETASTPTAVLLQPRESPHPPTLTGSGFSSTRLRPNHCSSFLRAGSKFIGTQQSDKQIYNVEVSIKHVNMKESFLCGFLRIEGLTKELPTLSTYFEGEIIGPKYTFQTKHEAWGATEKTDMQHWDRFPAWRPLANDARKPGFHYKNCEQRENMFMRWKEYFVVPDHRVKTIDGASFEGFYYICFNQIQGTISGIYFHAKSEKFQQLELKHVEDRGCFGAFEFR